MPTRESNLANNFIYIADNTLDTGLKGFGRYALAVNAGAKATGCLVRGTLHDVRHGGAPMSAHIARQVVQFFHRSEKPAAEAEQLSPRELEVLDLLVKGLVLKEVGEQLGIGLETVRTHVNHIYLKLHVRSRIEAVVKYLGRK